MKNKLNLGCGDKFLEGYTNLDYDDKYRKNVTWDLNIIPWKVFKDNQFDEIIAFEILEHLDDVKGVMEEIWRISKPNAVINITVPYYSGNYSLQVLEHKKVFGYHTFDYLEKERKFKIVKKKIVFSTNKLLKIFNFIPNICPVTYERFFAYILPSQGLDIILKAIKKNKKYK